MFASRIRLSAARLLTTWFLVRLMAKFNRFWIDPTAPCTLPSSTTAEVTAPTADCASVWLVRMWAFRVSDVVVTADTVPEITPLVPLLLTNTEKPEVEPSVATVDSRVISVRIAWNSASSVVRVVSVV